jgi:ribonuclease HIII
MGKTYDFVEEIDNGISFIRRLLQNANISANELKIQSGIKFACSTGSTFILYFSKGKTSKIYFEKEDKEVLSLMDKLSVKKETGCSKVPIYANYSISESNQDLVQLKLEESFSIIKKDIKKNTIKYIFDITDRDDKITVTQFLSGKLLLQGMDSALVTKIREIINSVEPISNKEEALTYIPQKEQAKTKQVIEQINGFDSYCDKARKVLSNDAYNYLAYIDKKQIVTAFGLLEAIKENAILLPLYNPVVYPVAKAFEGFILKMMIDKNAFTLEEYKNNPEIAEIGNWLRNHKFKKYIKDTRRDGYINNSLIAAWEGIRCEELHSDPARNPRSLDIITVEQAEAKIGAVCNAITSAYNIIIKNGYTEEEMLAHKKTIEETTPAFKELPVFDCHIGTDESGKGDYFGPLVIAGVCITKKQEELLATLGVRDSKSNSDNKNKELAKKIEELLGKTCVSIVCISPERYNSLYDEIGRNLNKLLGWGHARVMENLLSDNLCENAIADQFGDESIIKSALLAKGKSLNLIQSPKAERDIGVAAASILARARFLNELERLGKILGVTLSKGVNSTVESIAKNIYENGGLEKLKQFVKLHFQTTKKIIK